MDERARHLAHVRRGTSSNSSSCGLVGQLAEEQQVGGLLEAGLALGDEAVDEVVDLDAAVEQLAGRGHELVALGRGAHDVADAGESGEHALAGLVAQAALDVVLDVEARVDRAAFLGDDGPRVERRVSAARHGQ